MTIIGDHMIGTKVLCKQHLKALINYDYEKVYFLLFSTGLLPQPTTISYYSSPSPSTLQPVQEPVQVQSAIPLHFHNLLETHSGNMITVKMILA